MDGWIRIDTWMNIWVYRLMHNGWMDEWTDARKMDHEKKIDVK